MAITKVSNAVLDSGSTLSILDGKSFLDEDNMASNSATGIASQQSIKAYVDSQSTPSINDLGTGGTALTIYSNGQTSFATDLHVSGDIYVTGTVDGVDISALQNSTINTSTIANAALPKAGGTMTGNLTVNAIVDADNYTINGAQGTDGQVLTSTGSGVAWEDASGGGGGGYSGGNFEITNSDQEGGVVLTLNNTFDGSSYANGDIGGAINFKSSDAGVTQPIRAQIKTVTANALGDPYPLYTDMVFSTTVLNNAPSEAMRINYLGKVGIGTNNPTQLLDVNGTVELNNLTVAGSQGTDGQVLTSTGSGIAWEDASGGGGSYNDAAVDAHLNRSTASSGEVLSWNGSDYDWVAQSGGGGGGSGVLSGGVKVSLHNSFANQTILPNTTTKIDFDYVHFGNSNNAFNTTNNTYTVPAAGKYLFLGRIRSETFQTNANGQHVGTVYIYKNGSMLPNYSTSQYSKTVGADIIKFEIVVNNVWDLAQNDVIDFRFYLSNTVNTNNVVLSGNGEYTTNNYMYIVRIE